MSPNFCRGRAKHKRVKQQAGRDTSECETQKEQQRSGQASILAVLIYAQVTMQKVLRNKRLEYLLQNLAASAKYSPGEDLKQNINNKQKMQPALGLRIEHIFCCPALRRKLLLLLEAAATVYELHSLMTSCASFTLFVKKSKR